jgi:ssDNA-specific exonuclease RecJ
MDDFMYAATSDVLYKISNSRVKSNYLKTIISVNQFHRSYSGVLVFQLLSLPHMGQRLSNCCLRKNKKRMNEL